MRALASISLLLAGCASAPAPSGLFEPGQSDSGTGIAKVEYQIDGRPWHEAELGRVPHVDTWVQWTAEEEVEPGEHRVTVRATDRSGYTQTAVRTDVVPDGATGWHSHPFDAE